MKQYIMSVGFSKEAAIKRLKKQAVALPTLMKMPTGIQGLDDITSGGLPKGRPTLIYGSAGLGKPLIAWGAV